MGDKFEWQFDESADERPFRSRSSWTAVGAAAFWLPAAIITLAIIGGWAFLRWRAQKLDQALTESTQSVLNLAHQAVIDGDSELFFALQEGHRDRAANQLQPQILNFYRAAPQITNVERVGEMLHANAAWQEDGQSYQRVLFFAQRGGRLRQIATDPAFWGNQKELSQRWGKLKYWEVDAPWAEEIGDFLASAVTDLCRPICPGEQVPLTLDLRSDFLPTAEPNHIFMPSPRLIGLNEAGRPSDRFWQLLQQHLMDALAPAAIRFAVPSDSSTRIDYEAAAAAFAAAQPAVRIELIPRETAPGTGSELAGLDGAAFVPAIDMVTAGQVVDLTPFMHSDPDFDRADFYEQIWQGAVWEEHTWFMPQTALMPLIFYHRDAYDKLDLEEPLIGWTWSELGDDAAHLPAAEIVTGDTLVWGYLDESFNTLFSYAFMEQEACAANAIRPCPIPLSAEDIAAALEWYSSTAGEEAIMPDPSQLAAADRDRLLINSLFKAAIWADEPVYYEHRTLMFPMGVLPFPGSERLESGSPLWVEGSFISRQSARPRAVWQWLKFLSTWPPMPRYRLIPARPSVGQEMRYWSGLPRELAGPMRAAFPIARPVHLQDRGLFSWPALRAVMDGQQTPEEAAHAARAISWFGE